MSPLPTYDDIGHRSLTVVLPIVILDKHMFAHFNLLLHLHLDKITVLFRDTTIAARAVVLDLIDTGLVDQTSFNVGTNKLLDGTQNYPWTVTIACLLDEIITQQALAAGTPFTWVPPSVQDTKFSGNVKNIIITWDF